jgi:CelD/BcsL family acetyltransferase involved in cellulose biosynthesis
MGKGDVVEIANPASALRASQRNARSQHRRAKPLRAGLAPLASVAVEQWRALADRAVEPNGYYLPAWALAIDASAHGRTGVATLRAWSEVPQSGTPHLIGLVPVVSLWRACKIPLPALVGADPYGTLRTPLLDREMTEAAAMRLMDAAREAGAHALVLKDVALGGPAMKSFSRVLEQGDMRLRVLQAHARACLDATRDADQWLREALGAKKLKELRRQRHRLAGHGDVVFELARTRDEVARALEIFLSLEASGWKGRRGTALSQNQGDAAFIRRAAPALAEHGGCEIAVLRAGATPVAAAILLRHLDRAFYFKLGIDERFAKFSPGVQLTLDITRHFCADPAIASADSMATPDHPMISPIWRGRLAIADVVIPLRRNDPVAALIHAAMLLRQAVRAQARRGVRLIRKFKD